MKTNTFNKNWLTGAGLLLALPTTIFICFGILYELGISGPVNTIEPYMNRWGGDEPLGWNINLLILFGPVLAFLFTVFQVLKIEWYTGKEEIRLNFTLRKRWFPLGVSVLSVGVLAFLFLYFLVENYHHYQE